MSFIDEQPTARFDSCENCGKQLLTGERLSAVDFWVFSQQDGRRRPSYMYVCNTCYGTRQQWCTDIFGDVCEKCGSPIADGEYYMEKDHNCDGQNIYTGGLLPDETCYILCEACQPR